MQTQIQYKPYTPMLRALQLVFISLLLFSCGSSKKETAENNEQETPENSASETAQVSSDSTNQEDSYKIVFRKIDNKALLFVEDSLIYDSGTIAGNPDLEVEIFLTDYVKRGQIEIRIDSYNGVEPYNQADSHWELVYDIYKNDEIIDFVREANDNGDVGKVFEEFHFLDELE